VFRTQSNPKVAFPIASAVQREAQEINRLWAVPATLAGISLRKATKFDELGLGRFQSQAKPQSLAQRLLDRRASARYWAFRSSMAPPTDASIYASRNTSRCPPQDSRSGWIRYFLSRRALASPTTCRFNPAHSELPVIRPESRQSRGDHFLLATSQD